MHTIYIFTSYAQLDEKLNASPKGNKIELKWNKNAYKDSVMINNFRRVV